MLLLTRRCTTPQDGERLPCTASEEGTLSSWFVACAPEGVDARRVSFRQGDACALPAPGVDGFGPFDAVLASNLLCRCVRAVTCVRPGRSSAR